MIFVFLFDKNIIVEVAIKEPRMKKQLMNGFKNLGIKVVFLLIDDRKSNTDGRNKIDIVMTHV